MTPNVAYATVKLINSEPVLVSDIDGTISDATHRLHFIKGEEKRWDEFYTASVLETPISGVIDLLKAYRSSGFPIVLLTGRNDAYREITNMWLDYHDVPYDLLVMRSPGDRRLDYQIKVEWLKEFREKAKVSVVFEDRKRVVEAMRELGLTVFHVAEGDY